MSRPQLQLLGPVTIQGTTGKRPSSPARATEAVAFLALHPWDDHLLLDEAIWPGQRVTSTSRSVLMHQARTWLGTDPGGRPHVGLVAEDGYRLHDVDVDAHTFAALIGPSALTASTNSLTQALRLVRGRPLSGVNPARWSWADVDRQELIDQVAGAGAELARRALEEQQARVASWASAIAVQSDPSNEELWQLRLRAAAATGHQPEILATAGALHATLDPLGELEDETQTLLTQLLPAASTA